MRIRLSGAVGGVVLVVITGVILASIVDGILSFIEKYVVKEDESGKKFISLLKKINWGFFILFVILDLIGVFPLFRTILFALFSHF